NRLSRPVARGGHALWPLFSRRSGEHTVARDSGQGGRGRLGSPHEEPPGRSTMSQASDTALTQKWLPVSVAQANAISAMIDPVRRNLKITQAYHDLQIALTRLFGEKNVTWTAYATWASKTAGSFIRGEEAPNIIHHWIECTHYLGIDPKVRV